MNSFVVDKNFHRWVIILRVSIGIIYLWFGVLKFFPGVSPAEDLAQNTIRLLSFGQLDPKVSLLMLASWETSMGILLIAGAFGRFTIRLVFVHMICTFTPLILLPGDCFTNAPFDLTLVGQYILKNIVIISALLLINSVITTKKRNSVAALSTH